MEARHPYLFVYGTLKSTVRRNRFSRYLARVARLLGPASLPGRLYALRRYPAVRPPLSGWLSQEDISGEETVWGEVHRLLEPRIALAVLDAYEDRKYRRILREAQLLDGRRIRCWVYEWKGGLPHHRRLPAGRWPA